MKKLPVKDLIDPGAIALLVVLTKEGEIILRPIGGNWGSGIRDAVVEISKQHPGCIMQLFKRESNWKYFEGIVSKEQVLPYAAYPTELKKVLNQFRRQNLL